MSGSPRDEYREQMLKMLDVSNSVAEMLRESEDKVRAIIESSLDAIITINVEGCITEWNPAATTMFGWTHEEAVGLRLSETIIPDRYRERHEAGLKKFLETGDGPVFGVRLSVTALQKDGVEFPAELAILPLDTMEGQEFVGFLRDKRDAIPAPPIDEVLVELDAAS